MFDYSVEISHIYTNETFSQEHEKSVEQFHTYSKDVEGTCSTIVMIDDYNPNESLLDVDDFLGKLKALDAEPDFLGFEANMFPYREQLLSSITNDRIHRSYERYIREKEKLPCSFMTAIWYLIRLGELDPSAAGIQSLHGTEFKPSKYLINILPERFRAVESKTIELIAHSTFAEKTYNIDYIFYNSKS